MIDTHCHLTSLSVPVEEAIADLDIVVTIGTGVADCRAALALSERLASVYCAVGIHPNDAGVAADPEVRAHIEDFAGHARVVAIGETGFDTHWDRQTLSAQQEAFEWQAELARNVDKPLVLHVRDKQGTDGASRAAEAAISVAGHPRGVLHCCNGDRSLIDTALALGWYVSFAGNLTYKSATALRQAAAAVPLQRLLVETDSPYLTPVPHRGERNVPTNVRFTAAALAAVRGIEEPEMERILDDNARSFLGLLVTAGEVIT